MSLDKRVAKLKKLFEKAKGKKPEFDNVVSDGIYTGRITKAKMGESQNGRIQVAWQLQVNAGEFKGERVNWWNGLESENNIMFFNRDLVRLGKDSIEDPNDIESVLAEIEKEKPAIRIKVVTNGEFQNVRILKVVDANEEEVDETPEEAVEEEAEEEDVEEAEEKEEEEEEAEEEAEEAEEAEEVEEDGDETPELEEGSRVMFSRKGKDIVGVVKKIDYEKEEVSVLSDKGLLFKGIKPDTLSPAPTTKVKKVK